MSGTEQMTAWYEREIARLTAALHANHCHPQYEYDTTTSDLGHKVCFYRDGWEPNPEHPDRSKNIMAWRRKKAT